jgi:hypothetical protein
MIYERFRLDILSILSDKASKHSHDIALEDVVGGDLEQMLEDAHGLNFTVETKNSKKLTISKTRQKRSVISSMYSNIKARTPVSDSLKTTGSTDRIVEKYYWYPILPEPIVTALQPRSSSP